MPDVADVENDSSSSRKAVVLLVDDDQDLRLYVKRRLSVDYEVIDAGSGHEAVAQATATPPDLVLLDLGLPDIHGFQLLERLRVLPGLGQVPVVFMTGAAMFTIQMDLLPARSELLPKPFTARTLRDRVAEVLGRDGKL